MKPKWGNKQKVMQPEILSAIEWLKRNRPYIFDQNLFKGVLIMDFKMTQVTINVVIKKEEKGYSVYCPELGVASQGETFEETIENIKEAVELYIESAKELGTFDEVLDALGITEEELKKKALVSKIVTASVPIAVAV